MTTSTVNDIVKNVSYLGENETILRDAFEEYYEVDEGNIDIAGWTCNPKEDFPRAGKNKRLHPEIFKKNGKEICVINTSQYSNVGEYDYVVFSDDKHAVELFLKDLNCESKIEDVDSISQTL